VRSSISLNQMPARACSETRSRRPSQALSLSTLPYWLLSPRALSWGNVGVGGLRLGYGPSYIVCTGRLVMLVTAQLIRLYGEVLHPEGRYTRRKIRGTQTYCRSGAAPEGPTDWYACVGGSSLLPVVEQQERGALAAF